MPDYPSLIPRRWRGAGDKARLLLEKMTVAKYISNAVCSKRTCVADYEQTYSSTYVHCNGIILNGFHVEYFYSHPL